MEYVKESLRPVVDFQFPRGLTVIVVSTKFSDAIKPFNSLED